MKVAVLLPGQLRSIEKTYNNYKKNIFYNEPDLFIHSWKYYVDINKIIKSTALYTNLGFQQNFDYKIEFTDLLNPKYLNITAVDDIFYEQKLKEAEELYKYYTVKDVFSIANTMSSIFQYYSWNQLRLMIKNNEKYDLYLKIRSDLSIDFLINYDFILNELQNADIIFYSPLGVSSYTEESGHLPDHMFAAKHEAMDFILNYYNNFNFLIEKDKKYHPEWSLGSYCKNFNIKTKIFYYNYGIVR